MPRKLLTSIDQQFLQAQLSYFHFKVIALELGITSAAFYGHFRQEHHLDGTPPARRHLHGSTEVK